MNIERSMHEQWLSNTYLVYDKPQGTAITIDAGGPVGPLLELADREGLNLSHVPLTHHHFDHVAELGDVVKRHPDVAVLAHPLESDRITGTTDTIEPGAPLKVGELAIKAIHTPGHTAGMLSFLVNDKAVFTGDTLFKSSVGGVRGPGHTTYEEIKHSIMNKLMQLPGETEIYPGHAVSTTVANEWASNSFIHIWRGLEPEGNEPCSVNGEPATLVLLGDDYDGGHKAWVRWPDGSDDIVPGSSVQPG